MASQQINIFKSKFADLARPNKFSIVLPAIMFNSDTKSKLEVMCKAVNFPPLNNNAIEIKYCGGRVFIPGDYSTGYECAITFYMDEEHKLRQSMMDWMITNKHNYKLNELAPEKTLMHDIVVNQLSYDNNIIKTYILKYVVPTSVSEIGLSMESENQIEEFTVNFMFAYMDTGSMVGNNV